uniref:Str_synth domain-containing protein n=1 Tax=Rhabditophanes sp. KR3021 TaxID=114890 RepID=A0AC35U5J1_9BILA
MYDLQQPIFLVLQQICFSIAKTNIVYQPIHYDEKCLYENRISGINGPESLLHNPYTNSILTGTRDGKIIEIDIKSRKIKNTYIVSEMLGFGIIECDGSLTSMLKCGRPLGLQFKNDIFDEIYVADGIFGLYMINLQTRKLIMLADNQIVKYANDLIVVSDGIYFTESSQTCNDQNYLLCVIKHVSDGRVLFYNFSTLVTTSIADGLNFPNGIQYNAHKNSLLVAEMNSRRIIEITLNQECTFSVLLELPGYPDNIRLSHNNNKQLLMIPIPQVAEVADYFLAELPFIQRFLVNQLSYNSLLSLSSDISANSYLLIYNIWTDTIIEFISINNEVSPITFVLLIKSNVTNIRFYGSDTNTYISSCEF